MPPKFSVIIPTRERADTLQSALRTCTAQNYDRLEIIVSDNASEDETKDVVHSFRDSRIRYVNTGKRVSMSHNWEFALSHVTEGYVTIIGDDDGLLPDSVATLSDLACRTGLQAITWKAASYIWPGCVNEHRRNLLNIRTRSGFERRSTQKMLKTVLACRLHYSELPFLYSGCASYETIHKAMVDGVFFHSRNPDIYSAIALAGVLDEYGYSHRPYSISGASHHSTGTACFTHNQRRGAFQKYSSEENIPFHRAVKFASSEPIMVAEAFLQARDHISGANFPDIDVRTVLNKAFQKVTKMPLEQQGPVIDALNETARINGLNLQYTFRRTPQRRHTPRKETVFGYNPIRKYLNIDCSEFDVRDVYQASLLAHHLLTIERGMLYRHSVTGSLRTSVNFIIRELRKRVPGG